jgi:hypothetical protein
MVHGNLPERLKLIEGRAIPSYWERHVRHDISGLDWIPVTYSQILYAGKGFKHEADTRSQMFCAGD